MPGFPNLFIPIVDVRDVATAHVLAMTTPEAAGERFLLSNGPAIAMKEIGAIIKAELGAAARRVPTRSLPDVVVRLAAVFSPELGPTVPDLGYTKTTSSEKARRVLGWMKSSPFCFAFRPGLEILYPNIKRLVQKMRHQAFQNRNEPAFHRLFCCHECATMPWREHPDVLDS
jgi:nucleoside-diphosphate-sugar epimerase